MAIWHIFWRCGSLFGHSVIKLQFGTFSPSFLVYCFKINLATLLFGGYETASCGVVYTAQISPLAALLRLSRALKSQITSATHQGCQMVYFSYQKLQFCYILEWKMFVQFMEMWNKLLPFGIFNVHLVILWSFGTFFSFLVFCIKKNLATLRRTHLT
jgi:hypothetical protein